MVGYSFKYSPKHYNEKPVFIARKTLEALRSTDEVLMGVRFTDPSMAGRFTTYVVDLVMEKLSSHEELEFGKLLPLIT
jgi:hypothetical protein